MNTRAMQLAIQHTRIEDARNGAVKIRQGEAQVLPSAQYDKWNTQMCSATAAEAGADPAIPVARQERIGELRPKRGKYVKARLQHPLARAGTPLPGLLAGRSDWNQHRGSEKERAA
jgi:hypothetical protein